VAPRHAELDLTERGQLEQMVHRHAPWAVINASGYVRVDDAEKNSQACFALNHHAAVRAAEVCARRSVPLVTFSSDLVFDGRKHEPYVESDEVFPLSIYGRSKVLAEQSILSVHRGALIIRTAAFFGLDDPYNFLSVNLQKLNRGEMVHASDDQHVSPTHVAELADAVLDLLIDRECGIWHVANQGDITWYSMLRLVAGQLGAPTELIRPTPTSQLGQAATRPMYSALASERSSLLRPLDRALAEFVAGKRANGQQAVAV
jgi:dTDP-4-dehydrorhamnose reductase